MKAAVWHQRRDIRVEEFPDPESPTSDQVRLRVKWCGICGTDLEEYLQGPLFIPVGKPNPLTGRQAPMILGHEFVGEVIGLGSGISDLKLGDHVAVDTLIHCGHCYYCQHHMVSLCESLAIMGLSTDGGLAEYINAPRYMLFKYPQSVPDDHAALSEPASVCVRAVRKSRLQEGESVVVVGGGTIGLLCMQIARAMGASKVFMVEVEETRRALAMELGATNALNPIDGDPIAAIQRWTGGRGADVVLECAGTIKAMALSPEFARKGGRIVFVGLHDEPVPIRLVSVVTGEKELIGSFSHVYDEDFSAAVDLISNGKIIAEPMITARIPLEELVPRGLKELASTRARHLKILVAPS
jgi:(R,R)-butanediol dehydrogenase / meso-butanediol dehydrogenase / diacetyl reductase